MRALALLLLLPGCLTSSEEFEAMLAWASDQDLDGFAPRDGDCDDLDASVNPAAEDVWYDGVDRDCDGWDDNDADRDGSPVPQDCDDTDPLVSPDFAEECDGVDEDCDGEVDEGMSGLWYADADGDGQGDPSTELETCLPPEGYVDASGDCDDANPAVYSGAEEVCGDGVVNDCDGYDGSCRVEGEVSLGEWGGEVVWSVLLGDGDQDLAGSSVAFGELNGDGIADMLVGAPLNDENGADAGAVYVLLSNHSSGDGELLDDAFATYVGADAGFEAGKVVGFAGDISGDGVDDLLLSTRDSEFGNHGAVHLISTPEATGVAVLNSNGRVLLLDEYFYQGALVPVGDIDQDGDEEFAVGHTGADTYAGAVYIWGPFVGVEAISDGDAVLLGEDRFDNAGYALSATSDFNGDGVPDLLIGAPNRDSEAGAVYLLEGPISGTINLGSADAKLLGEGPYDRAGQAIGGAGDVDGDGLHDMVIGAPDAQLGGERLGRAYIFTSAPVGTLSISNAASTITGDIDKSQLGHAVGVDSDLDGDGFDDVVIGAPSQDGERRSSGAVFVFYNALRGATAPGDADLSFWGEGEEFSAGYSVAGGQDSDGDGVHDLLIGSPQYAQGSQQIGAAYLVLGQGP